VAGRQTHPSIEVFSAPEGRGAESQDGRIQDGQNLSEPDGFRANGHTEISLYSPGWLKYDSIPFGKGSIPFGKGSIPFGKN